jgi:hypothetical protein
MTFNVLDISKEVLSRMSKMDYELKDVNLYERLIFPNKEQKTGNIKRISEQELRLLFIEVFLKDNSNDDANLFYSIETPTVKKYRFGKEYKEIEATVDGRSASLDMCVFERKSNKYKRILNVEFKHENVPLKNIAKDLLKLIHEEQDGAFIHLLNNTNSGTLCNQNENRDGVLDKYYESFDNFGKYWSNDKKTIQIVVMSLNQKVLIYRTIKKSDLKNLKTIFLQSDECDSIESINTQGWKMHEI